MALDEERITTVGCGVNPASLTPGGNSALFKRLFCRPNEILVAFVGRLVACKGPQVLLEAIPHVLAVFPSARFVLVGDGPMRQRLTERVQELNLQERVSFTGHLHGQVLATFYHAADIVVMPSLYEPFGMVALEAMACGRPMVVTDTGGLSEIVDHEISGLMVPPNNASALAAVITRLLYNNQLRADIATQGRERALTQFSWQRVAERTIAVYEKIAG